MSSSKKQKKKIWRTSRVSPAADNLQTQVDLDDLELRETRLKKLNNMERSKLARDGVKMSTAETVSVIKNVKKSVDRFKEMQKTRRKCVIETKLLGPSKGICGLDGSVNDDPMKPNPRNKYLISYFSKLAESPIISEEIDLEYVDQMLSSGASIHCIDRYGQTILHEVAREWEIDVAQFLLERGADVNCADCYGRTPLHVAAAVDYADMVDFLVENGADIETKTKEELQTPLHFAARNDACESLKKLHELGADINQRDYKDRTPLQVAAELDRSETALMLLELGAKAADVDKSGLTAMVLMICKMPSVAVEALSKFHRRDRANRKQYYDLHLLEPTREGDREPESRSVLQVVVEYNQLELIKHPVMLRLIDIKWKLCGRFGVLKQVIWNIFIILLWTILAVTMKSPITYDFSKPDDIFQFSVMVLATLCTFIQIILEVREFLQSKTSFKKWQEWRVGEIKKDLKFCHPRWPQERSYLEQEIECIESKAPSYFSEFWNYLDWFVYVLLMTVSVCHITAWLTRSITLSDITIRIFAVTIIFVWSRFMKVARAFRSIGPFIVMLGHITKDCARFMFLYFEFYLPYLCAFWMIFGGKDKGTEVIGMTTFDDLAFSLFRITLVDDYDYEGMKEIDKLMANILLGSFLAISALVGINLFIALLSDTFQRVYDNAFSNAIMQQASIMQGIEEGLSAAKTQSVRSFIHKNCAPETLFYDDDMITEDGNELKKVTFQIKDDLDHMREQYHGLEMNCKEVVASIKSEVKKMKDKQNLTVSEITSELHLLKQLVQQLVDRPFPPGGDSGQHQHHSGNLLSKDQQPSSRGYQQFSPTTSSNGQLPPQQTMQLSSRGLEDDNTIYIQPHFAKGNQSKLSGQQFSSTQDDIRRLDLYREQRKKRFKKRKEQEDYLEQEQSQRKSDDGVIGSPAAIRQLAGPTASPLPDSFSYISDGNDQMSLVHQLKFRSTVTSPAQTNAVSSSGVGQIEMSIVEGIIMTEDDSVEGSGVLPSATKAQIKKDASPLVQSDTSESLTLVSSSDSENANSQVKEVSELEHSVEAAIGSEHSPIIDSVEAAIGSEHSPIIDSVEAAIGSEHSPIIDSVEAAIGSEHSPIIDSVAVITGYTADADAPQC